MNAVLLKALLEQGKKQQERDHYANVFNNLERDYRDSMEKAYGLESADDFTNETGAGRLADVIKSRILGSMFSKEVSAGRAGMRGMNPILTKLLREQGFKDAFQGAREAEMQIPDESDPVAMLNFFNKVRSMGNIPVAADDERLIEQKPKVLKDEFRSIMEKYGY